MGTVTVERGERVGNARETYEDVEADVFVYQVQCGDGYLGVYLQGRRARVTPLAVAGEVGPKGPLRGGAGL